MAERYLRYFDMKLTNQIYKENSNLIDWIVTHNYMRLNFAISPQLKKIILKK